MLFDRPSAPTVHVVDQLVLARVAEIHAATRDERIHEAEHGGELVVVPEPSGLMLMLLAGLACTSLVRRYR